MSEGEDKNKESKVAVAYENIAFECNLDNKLVPMRLGCVICERQKKAKRDMGQQHFGSPNDLMYHYITHSILELAQTMTNLQLALSDTQLSDLQSRTIKVEAIETDENDLLEEDNAGNFDDIPTTEQVEKYPRLRGRPKKNMSLKDKQHECKICGKVLTSKGNLNKHLVIHNPEKKFKCDQCSLDFNQRRDLTTHKMQIHTMERPYVCKICNKGFVHKHYLTEHLDYHSGERKFQCPTCGKRFQSASTLAKHTERHIGKRSHKCEFCAKAFFVRVDLRSHIRLVHEKSETSTGIPISKQQSSCKTNIPQAKDAKLSRKEARQERAKSLSMEDSWVIAQQGSTSSKPESEAETLTLTNLENQSRTMYLVPISGDSKTTDLKK